MFWQEWHLNKRIPFGGYEARFSTLYEDKRDIMCDSLRPEMGVVGCERNRMIEVYDIYNSCVFTKICTKEEGNAMYREMKSLDRCGYGRFDCIEWMRKNGEFRG